MYRGDVFWEKANNVFGAVFGSFLGSYDFFAWVLLATEIAQATIPEETTLHREILILATFGGTFLICPFGGALYGYIGDRHGRANALKISTFSMAIVGTAFGCIDFEDNNYQRNVVLFTLLRGIQALNYPAQIPGAAMYLIENSSDKLENKFASLSLVSAGIGSLIAVVAVGTVQHFCTSEQLMIWGWRIPFLAELGLLLIGRIVQWNMTPSSCFNHIARQDQITENPLRDVWAEGAACDVVVGVVIASLWVCTFCTLVFFLPWYATNILEQSYNTAVNCVVISIATQIIFVFIGAIMSDLHGHEIITYWSSIANILFVIPTFQMLLTYPDSTLAYKTCIILLSCLGGFGAGGIQVLIFVLFRDISRRMSSITLSWNISMCLFGGGSIALNVYCVAYVKLCPAYVITVCAIFTAIIVRNRFDTRQAIHKIGDTAEEEDSDSSTVIHGRLIWQKRLESDVLTPDEQHGKTHKKRLNKVEKLVHPFTEPNISLSGGDPYGKTDFARQGIKIRRYTKQEIEAKEQERAREIAWKKQAEKQRLAEEERKNLTISSYDSNFDI